MNTVNVECVEQTVNVECVKNTYEISSPVAGPRGKKGKPGPPGEPGPPNTLTIGTVDTGEAAATITGQSPNQVLNLTLPAGGSGGGGLSRLTINGPGQYGKTFTDLVYTDGDTPWISGTVAGYPDTTYGAAAIAIEIPKGTIPVGAYLKITTTLQDAYGEAVAGLSNVQVYDGVEIGNPDVNLLFLVIREDLWGLGKWTLIAISG